MRKHENQNKHAGESTPWYGSNTCERTAVQMVRGQRSQRTEDSQTGEAGRRAARTQRGPASHYVETPRARPFGRALCTNAVRHDSRACVSPGAARTITDCQARGGCGSQSQRTVPLLMSTCALTRSATLSSKPAGTSSGLSVTRCQRGVEFMGSASVLMMGANGKLWSSEAASDAGDSARDWLENVSSMLPVPRVRRKLPGATVFGRVGGWSDCVGFTPERCAADDAVTRAVNWLDATLWTMQDLSAQPPEMLA